MEQADRAGRANNDQNLDRSEINERLVFHQARKVGLITSGLYLKIEGNPVVGVKVKLVPDPVFKNLATATGTTVKCN